MINLFKLFHKKDPEEINKQIAQEIVLKSLLYRSEVEIQNNQYSADAGAEILYFLLHMFDVQLFKDKGPEVRNKIFDKIAMKVIVDYTKAVLKPETPVEMIRQLHEIMLDTFNERQRIYSMCKCLMVKGSPFAAKGSIIFALSFYIHKALRKTDRNDVEDILCGEKDIDKSELHDFPDFIETGKTCMYAMNTLTECVKVWRKLIKSIPYN